MTDHNALKPNTILQNQYSLHNNEYKLVKILGQGGFGITYLADDLGSNQQVVIKEYFQKGLAYRKDESSVVPASATDGEFFQKGKERFVAEAQILAKFQHKNIARILDLFEQHNTAYFVMQYEKGQDLLEYLEAHKNLSQQDILTIINPILDALEAIHNKNIYHRDIKPSNIYIRDSGSPMLIDFGSAKQSFQKGSKASSMNAQTPGYAAPEQKTSIAKYIGPWTDIYALGATMYYMIKDKTPITADDRDISIAEEGFDCLVPLAQQSLHQYTKALLTTIDKAMVVRRKDRIQNVTEFRDSLAGKPTILEPKEPPNDPPRKGETKPLPPKPKPLPPTDENVQETKQITKQEQQKQQAQIKKQKLEQQAQLEQEKKQTNRNLILVVAAVVLLVAGIWGYTYWQKQERLAEAARQEQIAETARLAEIARQEQIAEATRLAEIEKQAEIARKEKARQAEIARKKKAARKRPTLITVQGGTFTMGSNSGEDWEKPTHRVTVSSFKISKYETTNAQYAAYMNAIGASSSGSVGGTRYLNIASSQISHNGSAFVAHSGKGNHPVVCVTWYGANAYCKYNGGRLPTEAEWEFAARGGNSSNGYSYSGSNTLGRVAWYDDNSGSATHPVGTKRSNELGIHDMTGNVWEWCSDRYGNYSSSPSTNPQGPSSGSNRVYRGGGWNDGATNCRVAYRGGYSPSNSNGNIGFRLAVSL